MNDFYVLEGKFSLGQIFETRGAQAKLVPSDVEDAIRRHVNGDWGEVSLADREENERSLQEGLRLLSVYHDRNGVKFWIISEADRSVTTVLLPEDY